MLAFVRRNEQVRKLRELSRAYAILLSFMCVRLREGHYSERKAATTAPATIDAMLAGPTNENGVNHQQPSTSSNCHPRLHTVAEERNERHQCRPRERTKDQSQQTEASSSSPSSSNLTVIMNLNDNELAPVSSRRSTSLSPRTRAMESLSDRSGGEEQRGGDGLNRSRSLRTALARWRELSVEEYVHSVQQTQLAQSYIDLDDVILPGCVTTDV